MDVLSIIQTSGSARTRHSAPCPCPARYEVERWQTERHRLFESLYSPDAAMNPTGEQDLPSALPAPNIPLGHVDERTNAQLICHLLGGRFRETDASVDSMARRSRKTWLDGDPVEADGTQSLYGSGRRRPKFIQVATYLKKVIPHRQSYICRLVKGASAEVDIVRLEPKRPKRYGKAIGLRSNCINAPASDLHAGSPKRWKMFLYNYVQNPISRKGKILPPPPKKQS
jgi:hypothetical protein